MIHSVPKLKRPAGTEGNPTGEDAKGMAKEIALLAAEEKRELLTVATAGRMLGKSRDTIYRWLAEGRLAGRKVGGCFRTRGNLAGAKTQRNIHAGARSRRRRHLQRQRCEVGVFAGDSDAALGER